MACFRCCSKKKSKKVSIAIQNDPSHPIILDSKQLEDTSMNKKQLDESTMNKKQLGLDSYASLNSSWQNIKSPSSNISVSESLNQDSKTSDMMPPLRNPRRSRHTAPPIRTASLAYLKNNHKQWKDPKDIFRQSNFSTDKMSVYARANMYNLK